MSALQQEWLALQGQHERYEGLALAVKLSAFVVAVVVPDPALALALLALLWLQEAVLKTFQARLGERLLVVEARRENGPAQREGLIALPAAVLQDAAQKRAQVTQAPQMELFVSDERSAIDWLSDFLKARPSTYHGANELKDSKPSAPRSAFNAPYCSMQAWAVTIGATCVEVTTMISAPAASPA